MNPPRTNNNTELAKDYIAKRKIPQLFEALITGLMVHKPEDHVEFIIDSLQRYKDGNQQLKWDAFISRKGGMNNTLTPLHHPTDTIVTSAPPHMPIVSSRPPKLDVIPPNKTDKPKTEDRPHPSTTADQHPQQKVEEIKTKEQPQPSLADQHSQQKVEETKTKDRPQSPTPDQQEQRKTDDRQHVNDEENKTKQLLKGKPIIFVGGGPGSGKGTQCEKMIAKYGFTHLSAGDLIRAAAKDSTTEKGRYFNEVMSQGKLISTEDILGLLKDAIYEKANKASGFLIDGFPRRVDQGMQFEKDITGCDVLIYFDVPDDAMIERLTKRGETSGRVDDNKETITKRLMTFHDENKPILDYFGKQGKLVTINAHRKPDEVFTDVTHALERVMAQHQVGKQ